jgi:hypothetical protein
VRPCSASASGKYREILAGRWADIVDMLTMHPETRRNVVRLLGEIDAHR